LRAWYRKKERNSISTSSAYQGFSFWEKSPSMPLICGRSCGYERMARIDSPGLTIRNGKASPPSWYPISQGPGVCSEKSSPLDKLRFLIRSILKGRSVCIKESGTFPIWSLSNTYWCFLATKNLLPGKYHENHSVKSEIRISKFETNSNNQNPNDLNKKSPCQGGLT
jgi:hypothetical protein